MKLRNLEELTTIGDGFLDDIGDINDITLSVEVPLIGRFARIRGWIGISYARDLIENYLYGTSMSGKSITYSSLGNNTIETEIEDINNWLEKDESVYVLNGGLSMIEPLIGVKQDVESGQLFVINSSKDLDGESTLEQTHPSGMIYVTYEICESRADNIKESIKSKGSSIKYTVTLNNDHRSLLQQMFYTPEHLKIDPLIYALHSDYWGPYNC